MNLEDTAVSLAGQFGEAGNDQKRFDAFFASLGKLAFGGLGVLVLLGIVWLLYTIVVKLVLGGTQPLLGVFFFLFTIFAALALAYVVHNESKKDRESGRKIDPRPDELRPPRPDLLLNDPIRQPMPVSVIDDTTELLKIDAKTRDLK